MYTNKQKNQLVLGIDINLYTLTTKIYIQMHKVWDVNCYNK